MEKCLKASLIEKADYTKNPRLQCKTENKKSRYKINTNIFCLLDMNSFATK